MAVLFRAYTNAQTPEVMPASRMQLLVNNATSSGMSVLIGIFIRQVLVLIASALVIAVIIG